MNLFVKLTTVYVGMEVIVGLICLGTGQIPARTIDSLAFDTAFSTLWFIYGIIHWHESNRVTP